MKIAARTEFQKEAIKVAGKKGFRNVRAICGGSVENAKITRLINSGELEIFTMEFNGKSCVLLRKPLKA